VPETAIGDPSELPPETAPADLPVSVRGFPSAQEAERIANAVGCAARIISRAIDLERLDGITIAANYPDALAAVDRGYPNAKIPTPTTGAEIVGVAMSVNVLRHGIVKAHLVFAAGAMLPLLDGDDPNFPLALSLIAHECGHVADLKHRDLKFPGTILQASRGGFYQQVIVPLAEVLWEEYAACRASAIFCEDETPRFEESLVSMMNVALPRAQAVVRAYRLHGEIVRVLAEAGNALCEPLRMIAYLRGHLDGLGQELEEAPTARDLIAASSYAALADQLTLTLRDLWSRRSDWASLDEFEPLRKICIEAFALGGLYLKPADSEQWYIDIPLTPQTTP
jgi:hypothetical protein